MQKELFDTVERGDLDHLQALVEREGGRILNNVDRDSRTVLHIATLEGHEHIARWLLSEEEGAGRALGFTNVLAKDIYGQTALHSAALRGRLASCKAIAQGCKVENGEREEILNAVTEFRRTTLHLTAANDRTDIVRWLLSSEEGGGRALGFTNVLARDHYGETALHDAAAKGYLECCKAIMEGCTGEEREEMLNAGGDNVLLLAARNYREDIIRWLLSQEAGGGRFFGLKSETITALNRESGSVLYDAVFRSSIGSIQALLSGCTAGERIKLFLAVDKKLGWTPLHRAAQYSRIEAIQEMLRWEEAKTMVDARDHRGMTALHRLACDGGLDKKSREEWSVVSFNASPSVDTVRALLGLNPITARAAAAFVDVNAGLEIPEHIKAAPAAAKK